MISRLSLAAGLSATLLFSGISGGSALAQWNGGYGYGAPSGSYQQSCTDVRVYNNTLSASCTNNSGRSVRSQINMGACRNGGDIANVNGQLRCNGYNNGNGYGYGYGRYGRNNDNDNDNDDNQSRQRHHRGGYGYGYGNNGYGGYGYNVPGGSYQQSCSNARMQGGTLVADCRNNSGGTNTSYLNVANCNGADIGDINGQLRCVWRR